MKPLETLRENRRGSLLPLPPRLARLYGRLRMPLRRGQPYVIGNFVTTLDGIVSLNEKGHASGGDISGFSAEDRMVMGLLRAIVDVIVVGSGTLEVDRSHVWTSKRVYPPFASDYRRLRRALGKDATPLMVVVSGSGNIDLGLPLFASGEMRSLIVTSVAGGKRLRRQKVPALVEISTAPGGKAISARSILGQVRRVNSGKLILVEGGPRLIGDFLAAGLIDEQFLTLAPQIAGRKEGDGRLGLVMGRTFAPRAPLWGRLTDLRRGGSHLFLRYAFT